jgi:hypothetical protein
LKRRGFPLRAVLKTPDAEANHGKVEIKTWLKTVRFDQMDEEEEPPSC